MASFEGAIQNTLLWEGGYVNDPNDSGGETYRGISVRNWPLWSGWLIINEAKTQPNFPHSLEANVSLQADVVDFYRKNFWLYNDILDQAIANKIFDLAVNCGKVHAHKIVQLAVRVVPDGCIGPKTIDAINSTYSGSLITNIRCAAIAYHQSIVKDHPEDAKFLDGWLRRDAS